MQTRLRLIAVSALLATLAPAQSDDLTTFVTNGRPVLEYRQTPNPNKVYVSQLYSPAGVPVLLDSPPDHVHHHGIMLGLDANGSDGWEDGQNKIVQRPREPAAIGSNTLSQVLDWVAPDGHAVLTEQRTITVHPVPDNAYSLFTWDSKLTPAEGVKTVHLFTRRAYAGLGLRLPKSMDAKAQFAFVDAGESASVRNTETVTEAAAAACTGPAGNGNVVTVAMLAYPPREQHRTHWFTMSDSLTYMTATMNLYRQPMLLNAGETLEVKHGIAVWDGPAETNAIARARVAWAAAVAPPAARGWTATHVNVATPALGASATASSVYGDGYEADKAIDGKWAVRETDKWNSKENITPHYLKIDLGQARTIDRIRLMHEGVLPDGASATTSDFRLQGSLRPWGPFEDLTPPIRGNTDGVSEHVFAPRAARYVRLLIETGEQDDRNPYGRIFEMQVFSPRTNPPQKDHE